MGKINVEAEKNGEVFITSDSNNVFPKYFVERKNTYEPNSNKKQVELY